MTFRCLAFEPSEDQQDNVRGVTVIPAVGDQSFYAKTLMDDFAGALLSAFSVMVLLFFSFLLFMLFFLVY